MAAQIWHCSIGNVRRVPHVAERFRVKPQARAVVAIRAVLKVESRRIDTAGHDEAARAIVFGGMGIVCRVGTVRAPLDDAAAVVDDRKGLEVDRIVVRAPPWRRGRRWRRRLRRW